MNDPSSPMANPGRRMFEQARRLQKAKRQYLLRRGVTAVPTNTLFPSPGKRQGGDATVLQFPNKKEVD